MSNTKKMTVEEAYKLLDAASGEIYDQVFYDDKPYEFDKQDYEALRMAVDALKEKCGSSDLIRRSDAIDKAYMLDLSDTGNEKTIYVVDAEEIKNLPSAQPEDYTELKREFIRMAEYVDMFLICPDEHKETLIGFISRLAEFMPWTERD